MGRTLFILASKENERPRIARLEPRWEKSAATGKKKLNSKKKKAQGSGF